MSNVYTKDLSNEIYFLNDKNVVQEIDISEEVINPIASHQLVKNISDDVASYIEKTDKNIETISSDISSLQKKDEEIINNIDEVKSELIRNIISTANTLSTYSDDQLETISSELVSNIISTADILSTYSDKQLSDISSQIDIKIDNISSKVAVAYRPMGSVNSYDDLLDKLSAYLSSSTEEQIDSHIGEVWNVIGEVSSELGVIETGNNYVFVKVSDGNGYRYEWDDIGGIVDLSKYALSSDVSDLVTTQSKNISDYINSVSTDVSNTVESNFVHISGDTISGNLSVNSLTSVTDINAKTLYIGSTVKIEETKVALGNSNTTDNGQFVWNGIVSNEYNPPSAYGTFNINPSASINGVIVGTESLSSIISSVIQTSSEQVSNQVTGTINTISSEITSLMNEKEAALYTAINTVNTDLTSLSSNISNEVTSLSQSVSDNIEALSVELYGKIHGNTDFIISTRNEILSTVTDINTNLTSADTYISGKIVDISTVTIPSINGNITSISNDVQEIKNTSIPSINENISAISTDVGTLSTNVDIALEQVLKTVEFVGHVTFSSPKDAKDTISTLADLIHKFNIPEKSRIKNGAMYHVEFNLSSDNIPANELAQYYVDVKIDKNNSVRISHGDYIIFHDHETKQFIDISSITKENIYVTEVSFSDLYSLSTTVSAKIEDLSNTVSRDYAYLSGNNISNDHVLSGVHDFIGTINVANLLAENISADILSAETLSAVNLTAEDGVILTTEIDEATILSANISNLTAGIADIKTLYNDYISVENSLSASYIETLGAHISDEVVSNLTGTNVVITNLSGTNISASERLSATQVETPLAYISSAILSVVDVTNALSVNFGNVYDYNNNKGQSLSTQLNTLSTAIDNKIHIGTGDALTSVSADLSVIKLTNEEYANLLNNNRVSSNSIYIIEDSYIDSYGQIISNATNSNIDEILTSYAHTSAISNLTGCSEAATVKLVSALTIGEVGALSDSLSTTVNSISSKLSSAISSKIYIQDPTVSELSDGAYDVNLSVIKLTPNDYITKLTSDTICAQTLYVLCADYVDAFGQVISNAVNTSAAYNDSLSGYINDNELTTISKRGSFKESEVATVEFVNTIVQSRITNSYNKIYKALSVI